MIPKLIILAGSKKNLGFSLETTKEIQGEKIRVFLLKNNWLEKDLVKNPPWDNTPLSNIEIFEKYNKALKKYQTALNKWKNFHLTKTGYRPSEPSFYSYLLTEFRKFREGGKGKSYSVWETAVGFGKALVDAGGQLYNAYDYVAPDRLQPEKQLKNAFTFVRDDLFSPSFYKRNYKAIKSDPIGYLQTAISQEIMAWTPEGAWAFLEPLIKEETRKYLGGENFLNDLKAYGEIDPSFLTDILKLPTSLRDSISETVAVSVDTALTTLGMELLVPIAHPLTYSQTSSVLELTWKDLIKKISLKIVKGFYSNSQINIKKEENQSGKNMLNIDFIKGLKFASFNGSNFETVPLPLEGLSKESINLINTTVSRFKGLLGSINSEDSNWFPVLTDYTLNQLWARKEKIFFNEEQIPLAQNLIASLIWNIRSQELSKLFFELFPSVKSSAGFTALLGTLARKAKDNIAILGRWQANQAKNAYEAEQDAIRKARAQAQSEGAGISSSMQAQANESKKNQALTIGLGALALKLLIGMS